MIGGYHAAKLNRYEDLIQRRMLYVQHYGYLPELRNDSVLADYTPEEQALISELRADYRVLDMLNAKYIITGDANAPLIQNSHAMGNAWLTGKISYVDNADQEMAALSTIDPTHESVADKKFASVLGDGVAIGSWRHYHALSLLAQPIDLQRRHPPRRRGCFLRGVVPLGLEGGN